MRKILKDKFLALVIAMALTSLFAGAAVSATCSEIVVTRLSDGGFEVCELAGQWIASDGTEICAYYCYTRYPLAE